MRWIFITLMLLNLALLAWHWRQSTLPETLAATPAPRAERSLQLLSEVDAGPEPALSGGVVEGRVERTAGSELCTLVGPFPALLRAEYFQEHLLALGIEAEIKTLEVPGEPGYWVYQAPLPSRKAAQRRLQELQAKGVDSYVIPKGELENAISFGLFSLESGARQRLDQVTELGYQASIKQVSRSAEAIWISMTALEAEKIGESLWLDLLAREEGLEMRQNFCPAVASGEKFH